MWDGWWDRRQENLLSHPEYAQLSDSAKSFKVVPFSNDKEFAKQMNDATDTDVLVILNHGTLNPIGTLAIKKKWIPNSILLGSLSRASKEAVIKSIEEKPIRKGGTLLYLVCSLGECEVEPADIHEEQWVAITKKKLHPEGGEAIVSTENLLTPVTHNKLEERIGRLGMALGWSALGPFVFSKASIEKMRQKQREQMFFFFPPYHTYPSGMRVYDRKSDTDTFYNENELEYEE